MQLRSLAASRHRHTFEQLYLSAFPVEELTDLDQLDRMEEDGQCDRLILTDSNDTFYGLAILFHHEDTCLLAYLAIDPTYRGQGLGSQALTLIQEAYGHFTLEAESTLEADSDNLLQRKRRKNFYLKNNLYLLDYTVVYSDIEMELFSTQPEMMSIDEYFNLYDELFGSDFIQHHLALDTIML